MMSWYASRKLRLALLMAMCTHGRSFPTSALPFMGQACRDFTTPALGTGAYPPKPSVVRLTAPSVARFILPAGVPDLKSLITCIFICPTTLPVPYLFPGAAPAASALGRHAVVAAGHPDGEEAPSASTSPRRGKEASSLPMTSRSLCTISQTGW